ncbi:MAG: hypothetical protein AABX59_03185 [Nanoarchaeota archaeon]
MVTKVKKYGGSVLRNLDGFHAVAQDISSEFDNMNNVIAVVSAPGTYDNRGKMTDSLIKVYNSVREGADPDQELNSFARDFKDFFDYSDSANRVLDDMKKYLILATQHISTYDVFVSSGERVSSAVLSDILEKEFNLEYQTFTGYGIGIQLDSRGDILVEQTVKEMSKYLSPDSKIILEGFSGSYNGHAKTMARGGSDDTAALTASLTGAELWLMKDYPIMIAPPNIVPGAKVIRNMNYKEASLAAKGGSEIVHGDAIDIAERGKIPIYVANFNNQQEYTLIHIRSETTKRFPVATISHDIVSVLNLDDPRMGGVSGYEFEVRGVLNRIFEEGEHGLGRPISIDLSNSSPNDITLVLSRNMEGLESKLKQRLRAIGLRPKISYDAVDGLISVIGRAMKGRVGTHEALSGALAEIGINIKTTFPSRKNPYIGYNIDPDRLEEAVRALYDIAIQPNLGQ